MTTTFLDLLKQGMPEAKSKLEAAQKRFMDAQSEFQRAQQKINVAQAEFQQATLEFQAYQTLVNKEQRTNAPDAIVSQLPLAHAASQPPHRFVTRIGPTQTVGLPNLATPPQTPDDNSSEPSKTGAVREILKRHPAGMTPAEMWVHVHSQIVNRVYLYSILKRLKERGDVRARRGKYYFVSQVEEVQKAATAP